MTSSDLNDKSSTSSQVTLTSYMVGDNTSGNLNTNKNPRKCCRSRYSGCAVILDLPDGKNRYKLPKPSLQTRIKRKINRSCSRKVVFKRVPVLQWIPSYNLHDAIADLLAGITVGLTVIPQAIAYASIAGLPPQVGLYSSFMACFVYAIFGSCKDSAIGPTAISGLLTRENNHGFGVDGAVLLCFLTGCVEFLMGVLQLGFLIDFISGPVSIGFTSAAAIIIATTQVKDVLGLNYPGGKFLQVWEQIFEHIGESNLWDCVLGVSCLVVLFTLRSVKDLKIGPDDIKQRTRTHNLITKLIWLISTSRNILVVVFSAGLAYYFEIQEGIQPFRLTGFVKPGLPPLVPPPFHITVGNSTHSFLDVTQVMSSALIVVPLLGILENIALAKVFASGRAIDATQEMLAVGLCNMASSFVGSMPVTGALSRGAVNNASGVKTPLGGIFTGAIVLLALRYFTPYFSYIPKASLAAVIISAVVFMMEWHVVKPIWRTKKTDLIPAVATFLTCLFARLEIGITIGIGINVVFLLYSTARPSIHVDKASTQSGCEYLLITPDRSISFPSVGYVRAMISKAGVKQGSSSIPVVVDAKHIQGADFTTAEGIKSLIEDFNMRNQPLFFYNLKPSVISIFQGVQPKDFVYCETHCELNDLLRQYSAIREESNENGDCTDNTPSNNGIRIAGNP